MTTTSEEEIELKGGFSMPPSDEFFAGFFDADGNIGIAQTKGGKRRFLLTARVTNTNLEILTLFKARFNGKVLGPYDSASENRKPVYFWTVDAQKAEDFVRAVAPYLVVKAERAALALEFRELFKGEHILGRGIHAQHPDWQARTTKTLVAREDCWRQMAALNHRGVR